MARVAATVQVQSLAWELLHAASMVKMGKKKDGIIHLLEWLKLKGLVIPSVCKNVEELGLHARLEGK